MKVVSFVILGSFLIFINVVSAQSTVTENAIITGGGNITAGISPDSPFYFFDTAIDQIRLLLTFDETAKAKLSLEIARERLLEVREMVKQNKIESATRSQQEHVKILETVGSAAVAINKANATEEIENEIEIERELEEHEDEVEEIQNELKVRISIKGEVTPEQQKLIDSILNFMQNKTGEVKIKIDEKKGETKIKIKQTGLQEAEVERIVERIEVQEKLFEIRSQKALEKIEDAVEEISEAKSKLAEANATQINMTQINSLLSQADSHLVNAQTAFNQTKFGEAFGQATSAKNLAKNAKGILEKLLEEEEELEVEVKIDEGVAKIEVEIEGRELEFQIETTNRNRIISAIAEKIGVPEERIDRILKLTERVKPALVEKLEQEVKKKIEIIKEEGEEEKEEPKCEKDDDCARQIICPQVIGSDTPVCKNGVCTCGSRRSEESGQPVATEVEAEMESAEKEAEIAESEKR